MSYLGRIQLLVLSCVFTLFCHAQDPLSNLRQHTFRVGSDTLRIDTLSIVPNSFSVARVAAADYRLDLVRSYLIWIHKPAFDSVLVTYRVFPFSMNATAQRMRFDSIMNNFYITPFSFRNGMDEQPKGAFDFGNIRAEGSMNRAIGFGNNQDAVINSSLNMQLSGVLGDSIEIQAAITDNNIPIQPDGNTQQLNEFDQVFLQFKKKNWQLNLGDIEIRRNQSYFLNFYKRLQGITFQTTQQLNKHLSSSTMVSGSIAKGKFTRNLIAAQEGNQGPYRLKGANNEFFFIVLANTERVFIDGQLLSRGEDQDYVINYNSAEITFTPRRMITKDSRIQVEFEYADRNFLNANVFLAQEFELNKKLKISLGYFSNSDAKNSTINQELDPAQKQFLSGIGDSIQNALYPSATLDTFAAGKVLYQKIYFNPGTGIDSFYQYSTDPQLAKYSLSFITVGDGKGNYVPDFNGANGKVYKYVAPIAGVKQGSYEPVTILVTPKKQQILNFGIDYAITKNTNLKTELATSNSDVNTFSSKNNGDDRGYAAKFQLASNKSLDSLRGLVLNTSLDYEYVQRKFKPLERLRGVEFGRDWGLEAFLPLADEQIVRAGAGLKNGKGHSVNYLLTQYHRSDNYDGFQQSLQHSFNWKGWIFNNQFVLTHFKTGAAKGDFLRPVIDMSKQMKTLKNWRLGFRYALEQNKTAQSANGNLLPQAFSFDTYSVYLKSDELRKNRYGITFFTRQDKYPLLDKLVKGDRSINLNLQTELLKNEKRKLFLNTTFRKLKTATNGLSPYKDDETILGRIEYRMNEWKGLLNGDVLYEVGTGQEQRRDFAYLEVPAGTGQYAWIDYNADGVQQLNEFEFALFPDQAKYIRIFTPTNEFIKANYITFNYNFTISPKAILGNGKLTGMKRILSRTILMTTLQNVRKSLATGSFAFNPFKYDINNQALISSGTNWTNTLSFNRFGSVWGFDLASSRDNGKALLTYGYETRRKNDWIFKTRLNFNKAFAFTLNAKNGMLELLTPQFSNRNYHLDISNAEPMFTFIRGSSFRIVTGYKYEVKKNAQQYGGEKAVSNSLNVESKYSLLQNSSLTAKFTFNNIDFKYPATTAVSYIMLDGLQPGKNYLWSLNYNKRLLNNLELGFQYDGRKPGTSRMIHTGRATITALF